MKKIATYTLGPVFLVYIIYMSISVIIDYQGIYQKLYNKMLDAGYEIETSSINVEHFPIPKLQLSNLKIGGDSFAKNVEIYLSPLSILSFKPQIKQIEVNEVTIFTKNNKVDFRNHSDLIMQFIEIAPKLPTMKLNKISLINKITKSVEPIKNVVIDPSSISHQLEINWDKDTVSKINYQYATGEINVQINTMTDSHDTKISEKYKSGKLYSGAVRYNIYNLKQFFDHKDNYVDFLATKIQTTEPAELNFKIQSHGDQLLLSSITLNAQSINMSGSATLYDSLKNDVINIKLDYIDLNTLFSKPDFSIAQQSINSHKINLDGITRNINLEAKKIILGDMTLENVTSNSSINQQTWKIKSIKGDISNKGNFVINGVMRQNQYRSIFEGNISLNHSDARLVLSELGWKNPSISQDNSFALKAQIEATPIDYKLNNILLKIGDLNIYANSSIKFIGDKPRINVNLETSNLDIMNPKHHILKDFVSYITDLTEDMKSTTYLKKYIPIREIGYIGNFDLSFTDLALKDRVIDKLRIISEVSPAIINISSFYYQDKKDYFSGSGYLHANSIKPTIGLTIDEAIFHTNNFTPSYILDFLKKLRNDYDLTKANINASIKVNELEQGPLKIKDLVLKAKNEDILWNISELKCNYGDGKFESSGSLRMDSINLNLSYAYNDFNIKSTQTIFPLALFGLKDGWISSNGMISTSGDTLDEVFYNIYTKSTFIGKNLIWDNFNIDGLIDHTNNKSYKSSNLAKDTEYYMAIGSTTMNNIKGDFEINKGLFKFSDIAFDTRRTGGASNAQFNIYNNKILVNTEFNFKPSLSTTYGSETTIKLEMGVDNDILAPKKTFNLESFKDFLDRTSSNLNL
ncbi:MAG UNVERIFIED_CONTAM: AsmA-like C-terminal region-containing protein [Rickettsiaceae bacterium]|jgi:hypothetical protein